MRRHFWLDAQGRAGHGQAFEDLLVLWQAGCNAGAQLDGYILTDEHCPPLIVFRGSFMEHEPLASDIVLSQVQELGSSKPGEEENIGRKSHVFEVMIGEPLDDLSLGLARSGN